MTEPDPRAESHFLDLPAMIREAAQRDGAAPALIDGEQRWDFTALDTGMDRVAAALQARGLGPGDVVAICAGTSADYVLVFFGALRAGLAVAPLAPSSTPAQLVQMIEDAQARVVFVDAENEAALRSAGWQPGSSPAPQVLVRLDLQGSATAFDTWLATTGAPPRPVRIDPSWPFNIIYSSGTTGTPKGIVQSHAMRWAHIRRGSRSSSATGYGPGSVTLIATPLYSNTTLVCLIPSLAWGGAVVLMGKFDAARYLQLAEQHRATHTMLVPVQYRRLMEHPDFDRYDLSTFAAKFCTSAPFHAELKAEVLRRWPGALIEYYGLTEGGGTLILQAHLHPDKLHTVGQPAEGHDLRLIDEAGRELPAEEVRRGVGGEVVGRSPGMMSGYHRQPARTAEAEWFDAQGQRFIRTGDIGRFDEDGFLILYDRRKDMIVSGGFNIYPSDLEAVLRRHPAVADASVFGVPSDQWGETPVGCIVLHPSNARGGAQDAVAAMEPGVDAESIRTWANAQLGKTQRLAALQVLAELPRSAIGKVLKRELREAWLGREG